MSRRLLNFRVTFAVVAVGAMLSGAIEQVAWLAVPGAVAGGIAEVIGVLQSRARFDLPTSRALRGAGEFLPSIGVAAFEPLALGVTVAVVSYTIAANGMETVARSRGISLERTGGETMRRVLGGLAGLMLLTIPVASTTTFSFAREVGSSPTAIVAVVFAVTVLGCVRSLVDMALELRKA